MLEKIRTLIQRTWNMFNYYVQNIATRLVFSVKLNPVVHNHVTKTQSFLDIVSEASMWLIRTDFAFEYPRPMVPNLKFIGGFHCNDGTLFYIVYF